jgi:hypothetical protein
MVGGEFYEGVMEDIAPSLLTGLLVLAIAWLLGRSWNRRQAAVREQRRLDADAMVDGKTQPKTDDA